MEEIKIFRIRYYDDNTQYFFKGIEEPRQFAIIKNKNKMKTLLNFLKVIDNFFNPKCSKCGNKLSNLGGSTLGMSPEPVLVCSNPLCKSED